MERCHKKRAFPALRSPLKEPRAQLQEEYIGPSCMECAKYQVHALPRYLESYQHTYQLDTSLFDWNIVGDNEWRVNLLLPGGIYMFHNEHFHVTYVATTGLPPLFSCINPSKNRDGNTGCPTSSTYKSKFITGPQHFFFAFVFSHTYNIFF